MPGCMYKVYTVWVGGDASPYPPWIRSWPSSLSHQIRTGTTVSPPYIDIKICFGIEAPPDQAWAIPAADDARFHAFNKTMKWWYFMERKSKLYN